MKTPEFVRMWQRWLEEIPDKKEMIGTHYFYPCKSVKPVVKVSENPKLLPNRDTL